MNSTGVGINEKQMQRTQDKCQIYTTVQLLEITTMIKYKFNWLKRGKNKIQDM
jgi:hypothetical protein